MKRVIILFLFFAFTVFITYESFSQNSFEGQPYSFKHDISNAIKTKSSQKSLPVLPILINTEETVNAEKYANDKGLNDVYLYGKTELLNIDFKEYCQEYEVPDGKLFLLSLQSPNAYGLQVIFDAFILPVGAEMFIYSPDKSKYIGGYNSKSAFMNTFVTTSIWSDSLVIEYFEPSFVTLEPNIHIKGTTHIFRDFNSYDNPGKSLGEAGACTINVACPLGEGWKMEESSVCMISYTWDIYSGFASGVLLNNPFTPKLPIVLTANHVFPPSDNPIEYTFVFKYRAISCSATMLTIPYIVYGANVKMRGENSSNSTDFLIFELYDGYASQSLLDQNGVGYSGWESREAYSTSSTSTYVSISHPKGDVQKITKSTINGVFTQAPPNFTGNNYWKALWNSNMGTNEEGSSGGPLYNPAHKVIGQMHGGNEHGCADSYRYDWFGKFSSTWTLGAKSNTLADILTDGDESITSMSGYNASMAHCYNGVQDAYETGVDCGGPDCEPCSYVSQNYNSEPCSNGIMDNGETGIDCGCSCIPCGYSCSNGIKDGDETGIDCGGSCYPCDALCTGSSIVYTAASTIPTITKSSDYIGTSGTFSVGGKTFQAQNSIRLSPGFAAGNGFVAKIRYCKCGGLTNPTPVYCDSPWASNCRVITYNYPDPNYSHAWWDVAAVTSYIIFTYGIDCDDDFFLLNAEVSSNSSGNTRIYSSYVPGPGDCHNYFYYQANFFNSCSGPSVSSEGFYYVNYGSKEQDTANVELGLNSILSETDYYFNIFPNPNDGNMTLDYNLPSDENGQFEIYNVNGNLIKTYKLSGGMNKLSINDMTLNQGIYFYKTIVGDRLFSTNKLVILE